MPEDWRRLISASVSPLEGGVGALRVEALRHPDQEPGRPGRTAAVLVGIVESAAPEILLTRRSEELPRHAGQVSFPGGSADRDGESGVLTALREAHEEIGLHPDSVRPIGFLDRIDTVSDFRVLPVVGLVAGQGPWLPDGREVVEVFTLPLHLALDLATYRERLIERHGHRVRVFSLEWQGHVIWGVTAAILRNLAIRARRGATTA